MKNNDYLDIVNLNRPISKHKKMLLSSRAAQFAPFAALKGYNEAIIEEGRLTTKKRKLDDFHIMIINEKINYLNNHKSINVSIKYFVQDQKKDGGSYKQINGYVKKIDTFNKEIIMENLEVIAFFDIIDIESKELLMFDI